MPHFWRNIRQPPSAGRHMPVIVDDEDAVFRPCADRVFRFTHRHISRYRGGAAQYCRSRRDRLADFAIAPVCHHTSLCGPSCSPPIRCASNHRRYLRNRLRPSPLRSTLRVRKSLQLVARPLGGVVRGSSFDGDAAAVVDAVKEQEFAGGAEILVDRLALPPVMAVIVDDQDTA